MDDVERENPSDQAPVRRLTQTRLSNMLTREKAEGGRSLVRERYGVDRLEDLDAIVTAGRAAQRASLPADQQAAAELAEERRLRQAAEARAAQVADDARLNDALFRAGCSLPAAALAELRGTEGLAVGADPWTIQSAVDRLRARAPQLFNTGGAPLAGGAPPAPAAPAPAAPAPAVPAPGAPPAPAPPPPSAGFGGRGRAEAERRYGTPGAQAGQSQS